jgi:hypothetical protein
VQVKQALQQNAPGLEVLGSNYPPPPMSLLVARLVGAAQFFVIGVALAGDKLFSPPPPWAQSILRNKMNACAAAWFMGNMVHQNLMATGAFEVRERTVGPREVVRALFLPALLPVHRRSSTTERWCSASCRAGCVLTSRSSSPRCCGDAPTAGSRHTGALHSGRVQLA